MRKLTASIAFMLAFCFLQAGCESRTEYGECVGAFSEGEKDPHLVYKLSTRNTVLGVIFFQTIFAPAIWLIADFECPRARK